MGGSVLLLAAIQAARRAGAWLRGRSIDTTASGLAERFVRDADVVRPTAEATAALTLDQIAPSLAALDLSRAAILLCGPAPAMAAAAAGFGRTTPPLN